MMKNLISGGVLSALLLLTGFIPAPSYAASDDECAIWLCLPGGFPSGCGNAKSAMLKRIKKFKPPLPDFGSCVVNTPGGSTGSASTGSGAWVYEHKECTSWRRAGDREYCVRYEVIPTKFVKGYRCRDSEKCRNQDYVDVFIDGVKYGDTYYY